MSLIHHPRCNTGQEFTMHFRKENKDKIIEILNVYVPIDSANPIPENYPEGVFTQLPNVCIYRHSLRLQHHNKKGPLVWD